MFGKNKSVSANKHSEIYKKELSNKVLVKALKRKCILNWLLASLISSVAVFICQNCFVFHCIAKMSVFFVFCVCVCVCEHIGVWALMQDNSNWLQLLYPLLVCLKKALDKSDILITQLNHHNFKPTLSLLVSDFWTYCKYSLSYEPLTM